MLSGGKPAFGGSETISQAGMPPTRITFLACWGRVCYLAGMPYRPKRTKESEPKMAGLENDLFRASQSSGRRRRELATRSTLSRLRNRKSALK
jgi:hypothetical protein